MINVLVLGKSGMLGAMVHQYLSSINNLKTVGTERNGDSELVFDAEKFLLNQNQFPKLKQFDYIINCIGIIKPYCKDDNMVGVERAIKINALFPHILSNYCNNSKIIQIATDCVYSGEKKDYVESDLSDARDVYGKTKSLGEVIAPNVLHIRSSIIGPEIKSHLSLLDWFRSQPIGTELTGYTHHLWNGVTTFQFAQLCEAIISQNKFEKLRKIHHCLHYLPNETVNKYELLKIFIDEFKLNHPVKKVDNIGPAIKRTLATNFPDLFFDHQLSMKKALAELNQYMIANTWPSIL